MNSYFINCTHIDIALKYVYDKYPSYRLVATIQQGTPNCPVNAAKMKLKPNMQQATFKQVELYFMQSGSLS